MTDSPDIPAQELLPPPIPAQLKVVRHENFESWYSNNIQFQPSEWDLRMTFGEVDFANWAVQQHTAMTVSWLQAKIMHHFLTVQLAIHELSHGKIPVPASVFPPEPQPPEGILADDPGSQQIYELIKKLRERFIESLK